MKPKLLGLILGIIAAGGLIGLGACSSEQQEADSPPHPGLAKPALAAEKAPDIFKVRFQTTQGSLDFEVTRDWAPIGVDRFYNLVRVGFFEEIGMIRVIDDFMAQFGVHGAPAINRAWSRSPIRDDPRTQSNLKGTLVFAKRSEPNSRTTQLFINFKDNKELDASGFAPIGRVIAGIEVLEMIHRTGESGPHRGPGPSPSRLDILGNDYLRKDFPELDYIMGAEILD